MNWDRKQGACFHNDIVEYKNEDIYSIYFLNKTRCLLNNVLDINDIMLCWSDQVIQNSCKGLSWYYTIWNISHSSATSVHVWDLNFITTLPVDILTSII